MQSQDKKNKISFTLWICLLCLWVVGCGVENKVPITSTVEIKATPSATASSTITPLPTITFTPSHVPIILPAVTMSPQQAEDALQELLRTNGNCTGKCLAGIRPDEMTVQEAVDEMAQWGMLRKSKEKDGRTFINKLDLDPSSKQANLNLTIILNKKFEPTYGISFRIPRFEDGNFVGAEVWQANRETWQAFQFDNLLKAYGTPSFVGFRLDTWDREGKFFVYTLYIVYEQMNLEIGIGGLAHSNGRDVFICPSKDHHSLGIDINPEVSGVPLGKTQEISPITWQGLTSSDLNAFYEIFTDEGDSNGCVITTLEKIRELEPYFQNVGFPPP